MKWKKIMGLLIVAVLLTGGLAVIGSAPVKGQTQPETVNFGVNQDRNDALISLAEGDSDIFMQTVEATIYAGMDQSVKDQIDFWKSAGGYNNYYFNAAWEGHNTTEMNNAISSGWITEDQAEGPLYEANDWEGNWRFNPFSVQNIRYAMNHLVDRQAYIDNLQDGFGDTRYTAIATGTTTYEDYFKDMVEEGDPNPDNDDGFGITPSGDQEWAANYVNDALTAIANNTDDTTNTFTWDGKDITFMGNVRTPSEGDSGFWEYNPPGTDEWNKASVIGAIREEDWRLDQGQDFAQQLRDQCNLDVTEFVASRSTLSPLVFYGDPHPADDVRWNFYTGGWLASGNVYYPDVAIRQMYAPAYGFTQSSWAQPQGHWHYGMTEAGSQINDLTLDPYSGKVEDIGNYWSMLQDAIKAGVRESLRVFTVTETNYYCYDDQAINNAVPNQVTGWDQVFGPLTLDSDSTLNVDFYSSEGALYMDNWNWYGGSTGAYGANQRRWVLGQAGWNHPQEGTPIEMQSEWSVSTDYTYNDEGVLQKNMDIPSSAMEYDPHNQTWESVDTYYDGNVPQVATSATITVNTGTWHDGTDFNLRTIAEYYGRVKNIVYPNEYNNNTDYYVVDYSDSNMPWWENVKAIEFHPADNAYTIYGDYTFPEDNSIGSYYTISPRTSQSAYEAIHQDVEGTDYSANDATTFGWAEGQGDVYVHLMGKAQINDYYIPTMQNMQSMGYVPPQVNESQPLDASLTYNASEYADELQANIDFANANNNLFISYGPYYINDNQPAIQEMQLKRFDGYTDYFSWDYWTNQFQIRNAYLTNLQVSDEVTIGDDLNISADGYVEEVFPDEYTDPITTDHTVEGYIYDETGAQVDTFDVEVTPGDEDSELTATYNTSALSEGTYTVEIMVDAGDFGTATIDSSVLAIAPTDGGDGGDGTTDDGDGGGDGGIPGFTLLLLALAAVVAIAIYHKKPR